MFNISPAPAALAKRTSKAFSSFNVMFSRLRPPLGLGLSALIPPWPCAPGSPCSTTRPLPPQSKAASSRSRAAHHLDALTLLGGYFPSQCCFQPPDLALGAFDHLFPSESDDLSESHLASRRQFTATFGTRYPKHFDSISYGSGISPSSSSPSMIGLTRAIFLVALSSSSPSVSGGAAGIMGFVVTARALTISAAG